jgi:hypothetical protein
MSSITGQIMGSITGQIMGLITGQIMGSITGQVKTNTKKVVFFASLQILQYKGVSLVGLESE